MKKLLFVGIVGVLMTLGLVLAGCDDLTKDKNNCREDGSCVSGPAVDGYYTYQWCQDSSCKVKGTPGSKCDC